MLWDQTYVLFTLSSSTFHILRHYVSWEGHCAASQDLTLHGDFNTNACIAQIAVHSIYFRLSCEHPSFCIHFLCDCHNNSARLIPDGLTWDPSTALRFIVPFRVLLCYLASRCFFLLSSSLHLTGILRALRPNVRYVHTFSFHLSYTWTWRALRTLCSQPRSDTARGLHYYCVHGTNCCPLHWL